ncbi:MAG: lysoplasmalogenase [Clostridia bacterium]|nr:lysoplasmalogenase [Clostridia bacterium]
MILNLCFAALAAAEFILVPYFLEASKDGRSKKSQILKAVCSTLFLAAGILSCIIVGNSTDYAKYIVIGLALCWIGDFFLHPKQKNFIFIIGALFFLAGHIYYICAYCTAISALFPQASFWDWREIIVFVLAAAAGIVAAKLLKVKINSIFFVGVPYAVVLLLMLIKASSLGIRALTAGVARDSVMFLLLIAGAVLFTVSDVMLAVNSITAHGQSIKFRRISIITYYIAQFLIATTTMIIFA